MDKQLEGWHAPPHPMQKLLDHLGSVGLYDTADVPYGVDVSFATPPPNGTPPPRTELVDVYQL